MGMVIYRRVTNVLEVPSDVFLDFIGKGLTVKRHEREDSIKIEVDAGKGIGFNHETDSLEVIIGSGLHINDENRICVNHEDRCPDPFQSSEFETLVHTEMTSDGNQILLKKTYQKFLIERNSEGHLLNVIPGEKFHKEDSVILNVVYGYGSCESSSNRSSGKHPNFYNK